MIAPATLLILLSTGMPAVSQEQSQLPDILVEGVRRAERVRTFVEAVAPPTGEYGLARWRTPICVGVGNMRADGARIMADRVSDWAYSLGLTIQPPGCEPNIVVVYTDDGASTARDMVRARPRQFRTGMAGADRGTAALRAFQEGDRPVRWWHVSMAIDDDTGNPVGRLPGQAPVEWSNREITHPTDLGVNSMGVTASRLTSQVRQDLQRVVVVIDSAALDRAGFGQVADYVAFVALAQIDPDATASGFPSILNLFDPTAAAEPSLTDWDRAFLAGLYGANQNRRSTAANVSQVAGAMVEALGPSREP